MTTLLYSHPACIDHDPGRMHPECPARLKAVLEALEAPEFAALERRQAPRAEQAQIARVHGADYVAAVLAAVPRSGHVGLDPDTFMSPGSGEAALRAAGALCAAADAVMAGEAANAFCAVRPPGHHAEQRRAKGFCLFNNVAVGAAHARAAHGLKRVAVVDFDVHHGNGTQAMFWDNPEKLFASTHQMPLFPFSGVTGERGVADNIVNVPLPPMSGSAEFRRAMSETILPVVSRFKPEFLFISAGFDAHEGDPLASLRFHEEDFGWATAELVALAKRCCAGRLVSTLEGGYKLDDLARSSAAHVRALMAA
ncbi:MAG: histone deacetylase family protein [Rhodospirillales bacterium]|nr:histone deacetylase family protein [Rhodospirillales bacterium]